MQTKIMKIYRISFWKAGTTISCVIPLFIILIIVSTVFPSIKEFLYFISMMSWLIPLFITQYFYIIITDKEIIIKNAILGFWKREYKFEDIISVKLEHTGGFTLPYMQVKVKNKKGWWKYVVDMVPPKEYKALIKDIEDRNIPLEVKGMKVFLE